MLLLFECSGDHRDLHVLTHSFPTRRSSDLIWASRAASASRSPASASFCATQASPLASNSVGQYADDSERVATALRTAPSSGRSEEHTSELQSLMRISYAVFCLKKKTTTEQKHSKQTEDIKNTDTHTIPDRHIAH